MHAIIYVACIFMRYFPSIKWGANQGGAGVEVVVDDEEDEDADEVGSWLLLPLWQSNNWLTSHVFSWFISLFASILLFESSIGIATGMSPIFSETIGWEDAEEEEEVDSLAT